MKLRQFEQIHAYNFLLSFENGEIWEADLKDLIGRYVTVDDLHTAYVNSDWGCLEFLGGQVDIEPKTLYRYAHCTRSPPPTPATATARGAILGGGG